MTRVQRCRHIVFAVTSSGAVSDKYEGPDVLDDSKNMRQSSVSRPFVCMRGSGCRWSTLSCMIIMITFTSGVILVDAHGTTTRLKMERISTTPK
jgi:hypothetical protein